MKKSANQKGTQQSKTAKWAMWLGLSAFAGDLLLAFYAFTQQTSDENVSGTNELYLGILVFIIAISALVASVRGLGRGERSWVLWVGLIPAVLIISFYLIRFVGGFHLPY